MASYNVLNILHDSVNSETVFAPSHEAAVSQVEQRWHESTTEVAIQNEPGSYYYTRYKLTAPVGRKAVPVGAKPEAITDTLGIERSLRAKAGTDDEVGIDYTKPGEPAERRRITVLGVSRTGRFGATIVAAYDLDCNEPRHFRLDRISKVVV